MDSIPTQGNFFHTSNYLLQGGAFFSITITPELPPEVTSGHATFVNLGTVELLRRNGSLVGLGPIPGL